MNHHSLDDEFATGRGIFKSECVVDGGGLQVSPIQLGLRERGAVVLWVRMLVLGRLTI